MLDLQRSQFSVFAILNHSVSNVKVFASHALEYNHIKQYILSVIESCDDPESVMKNYRRGLELINSKKHYDEFANAGFFTLVREDDGRDTREEVVSRLADHFGLE